jgi:xanthine dehydrogenase small subunit
VDRPPADSIPFTLDGTAVVVPRDGSLLDALREHLHVVSVKDGCSPQGQCGCCTVWVDGRPRVACVTPVSRVRGRAVTTVDGLPDASSWANAFADHGGSQCGFCTPGIIMRAAALDDPSDADAVRHAMLAHLCRCTGWQPVVESVVSVAPGVEEPRPPADRPGAARRAVLEGGVPQTVGPEVALGRGGFADDVAPADALVAVPDPTGGWVVGETLAEARSLSGKVQGRRTTEPLTWPIDVPPGSWSRTLQTTWVEPAYLEPDASWCRPGGEPMSSLGNGGAFGGKSDGELGAVARRLADEHGRTVRVLRSREEVVRRGAKRPPLAAAIGDDGRGVVHVARTPGIADAIRSVAPDWEIVELDVVGPPTASAIRAAGWAEAAVLLASQDVDDRVVAPSGAEASAAFRPDGSLAVTVRCGDPLDPVTLRSYCIGAAHMALGWVTSEGLSVGPDGTPNDLTMRSFGILRAVDTPHVDVEIADDDGPAVNGSDAVFAAVAAAAWRRAEWAPRWPVAVGT